MSAALSQYPFTSSYSDHITDVCLGPATRVIGKCISRRPGNECYGTFKSAMCHSRDVEYTTASDAQSMNTSAGKSLNNNVTGNAWAFRPSAFRTHYQPSANCDMSCGYQTVCRNTYGPC